MNKISKLKGNNMSLKQGVQLMILTAVAIFFYGLGWSIGKTQDQLETVAMARQFNSFVINSDNSITWINPRIQIASDKWKLKK